ncbi:mechanosensitive ion channel family protein [Ulvibacterium marinum]|uniref:Mechanosensing system component YbdG n=1 Tax=Ulvibacterium marinum TaxID=2419782 RepID=A0A3B0C4N8_9FLAO|nr:mechanosensitive ion channel domain-containing protein [Ulvibacterium marinum]RKN81165.1 mechanosensitive ion channel family protein [Ulvibacterium marinum]
MDTQYGHILYDYLLKIGIEETPASYINLFVLLVGSIAISWLLDFIIWKILRTLSVRLARRTATNFDNFLVAHKVPRYIAHVFPLLLLFELIPIVFMDFEYGGALVLKVLMILGVLLALVLVKSLLSSTKDYLRTLPHLRDKPLDSYIQVFMIFAWAGGILTIFAIITDTTIWKFFTALGAASAVILLIFKDSILGLVASIQVSINDMVRIGDWITFEKYGADGDVIEISLATVKVQNFDKTITTIPTYALISDSFKNWRGMQKSGGRRIKRALIVRQKSVKFLSPDDVESLMKIELITRYLETRDKKIASFNQERGINKDLAINGRNLTNLGVFRKYMESYLENHSAINEDMTLMIRQLNPTPQGIPLEIYAFSSDKRWENYEYIMADIFDHLLAALPYFELEVFELPTSLESAINT